MLMARLRYHFYPNTIEQALGLGYLVMAISMIPRPFLAGVENLNLQYGLPLLDPRTVGALLAVFALTLILKRRCGRKLFGLMLIPLPVYGVCLAFYFKDHPMVGLAATLAFFGLTRCLGSLYKLRATLESLRATQHERGVL